MTKLRGGPYSIFIKGIDELQITHDNVMPEACCTSFQVHFQIDPSNFAAMYNASVRAPPDDRTALRLWQRRTKQHLTAPNGDQEENTPSGDAERFQKIVDSGHIVCRLRRGSGRPPMHMPV